MEYLFFSIYAAFAQTDAFAAAIAQVIQLGAADHAGAFHFDLGDARRIQGKFTLHAFALHYAADVNISRVPEPLRAITVPLKI